MTECLQASPARSTLSVCCFGLMGRVGQSASRLPLAFPLLRQHRPPAAVVSKESHGKASRNAWSRHPSKRVSLKVNPNRVNGPRRWWDALAKHDKCYEESETKSAVPNEVKAAAKPINDTLNDLKGPLTFQLFRPLMALRHAMTLYLHCIFFCKVCAQMWTQIEANSCKLASLKDFLF